MHSVNYKHLPSGFVTISRCWATFNSVNYLLADCNVLRKWQLFSRSLFPMEPTPLEFQQSCATRVRGLTLSRTVITHWYPLGCVFPFISSLVESSICNPLFTHWDAISLRCSAAFWESVHDGAGDQVSPALSEHGKIEIFQSLVLFLTLISKFDFFGLCCLDKAGPACKWQVSDSALHWSAVGWRMHSELQNTAGIKQNPFICDSIALHGLRIFRSRALLIRETCSIYIHQSRWLNQYLWTEINWCHWVKCPKSLLIIWMPWIWLYCEIRTDEENKLLWSTLSELFTTGKPQNAIVGIFVGSSQLKSAHFVCELLFLV